MAKKRWGADYRRQARIADLKKAVKFLREEERGLTANALANFIEEVAFNEGQDAMVSLYLLELSEKAVEVRGFLDEREDRRG